MAREVKFAALMRVSCPSYGCAGSQLEATSPQAFTGHFGCMLDQRKGHLVKVSPPALGQGLWDWSRVPFFVHKVCRIFIGIGARKYSHFPQPANGTLDRQDLYRFVLRLTQTMHSHLVYIRLQKTFKALYDWDNTTFARRGGRE